MAPGIRLVPWSDVPETQGKKHINEMRWQQARHPTAALLHDLALPKQQFFAKESKSSPIFNLSFQDRDITLCAGLFGPVAPVIVASWFDFPSWYPTTGCRFSIIGSVNECYDERPWPPDAYEVFPAFYKEYTALSQPDRDHLHIPLDRPNKAMRRAFPVDAAIDLGIALESLFLSDLEDERGELSFRLRLRGARYLGKTPAERKRFNKHLRSLYSARSIAVHTGTLPERIDHLRVKGLLETGYEIAATTLKAMIRNGQPDWNEVVFS